MQEQDARPAGGLEASLKQMNLQLVHIGHKAGTHTRRQQTGCQRFDHAGMRTFISVIPWMKLE